MEGGERAISTPGDADPSLGSLDILSEIAANQVSNSAQNGFPTPSSAADGHSILSEAALHAILFADAPRDEDITTDPQAALGPSGHADSNSNSAQDLLAALKMLHTGHPDEVDSRDDGMTPFHNHDGSWTDAERLSVLRAADRKAEAALSANALYAERVRHMMSEVNRALNRGEELETLAMCYAGGQASGEASSSGTYLAHPDPINVSLPMFKWKLGIDMPIHEHAMIRERYNSVLQQQPWQSTERKKLADEVMRRARQVYLCQNASSLGASDPCSEEQAAEVSDLIDWDEIARITPGRTALECKIQWTQRQHPLTNRSKWSEAELEKLAKIATRRGEKNWKGIADELGTDRTPADCVRQYRGITQARKDWTAEEDRLLREAVSAFGQNWQAVANHVGRTSNQCINRWSKTLKPNIKKGKWDAAEDEALRAAVAAVGTTWKLVAPRVKGRTDAQCRERWCNILDPRIKIGEWTQEEDNRVVDLRAEGKTWSEISKAFDGSRTDNHIMRRYTELTKPAKKVKKRQIGSSGTKSAPKPLASAAADSEAGDIDIPEESALKAGKRKRPSVDESAVALSRPKRQASARVRREAYVEDDDELSAGS